MRVLLNTLTAVRRKTGIGHYVHELLRCFARTVALDIVPYPDSLVQNWLQRKRHSQGPMPHRPVQPWKNTLARTIAAGHFRLATAWQRFDLYHEPNFIPLPCNRPTVATLLDLSVVLHPEWHPADRVRHFERHLHRGLGQCEHFFAISDACRQELIDNLGIPAHKITRTYMGVRSEFRPLPEAAILPVLHRLRLPRSYLLYVGTLEPRKNLLRLLQAYCALPSSVRSRCPLVLAGGWGWNTDELAAYYHAEACHRNVVQLGYIADEDLPGLYNGARALVFPSLYEGFGLPPLEMLGCGGAVLASTAAALRETLGNQAHFIDPFDVDGWRAAMQRVIEDDDWRDQLTGGAIQHARQFTWEECAAQTIHVYRRVSGLLARSTPAKSAAAHNLSATA